MGRGSEKTIYFLVPTLLWEKMGYIGYNYEIIKEFEKKMGYKYPFCNRSQMALCLIISCV